MSVHVFAGPTIAAPDILAILPGVVIHPPVRHGDLLALDLAEGDSVAIIDGVFFRTGAIRHKEVLHLLQRGTAVWGAASMGALRAAELDRFGMRGVGTVYHMYANGVMDGDDEVAVMHGPAESGYRPMNEPLAGVRLAASRAQQAGVLGQDGPDLIIAAAKALPFADRTYPAILAAAVRRGLPEQDAGAFRDYLTAHPCDVKREDAAELLRLLAGVTQPDGDAPAPVQLAPVQPAPVQPAPVQPAPVQPAQTMPMTSFLLRWIRSAPDTWIDGQPVSVMETLTACQLLAADYPELHYRVLLPDLVRRELAGSGRCPEAEADLAEWEPLACEAAAARGLIPADAITVPPVLAEWLTPAELDGPAQPAIARALVRSYRWTPNVRPIEPLVDSLRHTEAWRCAQAEVARAKTFNAELAAMKATFDPHYISDARLHEWLRDRWGTPDLRIAMLDRGFCSDSDLRGRAAVFLPLDVLRGVRPFSLAVPVVS
jgi:hypothetical protein